MSQHRYQTPHNKPGAESDEQAEPAVSDTPFARVLTAYMWSKTPPWSAGKLAAVLGLHRVRVSKWIYGDTIPELHTMLAVMARLTIPIKALLDAYAEDGIEVPPLEADQASIADQQARVEKLGAAAASRYPIPGARKGRGGGSSHTSGAWTPPPQPQPPQPQPPQPEQLSYEAPTPQEAVAQQERQRAAQAADTEWATMLEHTRQTLRMMGMVDSAIDAMLSSLSRPPHGDQDSRVAPAAASSDV